jgi:tetratricopeptide (TPR) repeat protein
MEHGLLTSTPRTALSLGMERGPAPMAEWRGQPNVESADVIISQFDCTQCREVASTLLRIDIVPYRTLSSWCVFAQERSREAKPNERCLHCGGILEGVTYYHAYTSALECDIVLTAGSAAQAARHDGEAARRLSIWTPVQGYEPATDAQRNLAAARFEHDAIRRELDLAYGTGRSPERLMAIMGEAADRLGILVLEPYMDELLRYTEHPLDFGLFDHSVGTSSELAVRDRLEVLARQAAEASGSLPDRLLFAQIVRRRVQLQQRPYQALETQRRWLLEAVESSNQRVDQATQWSLLAELALVHKVMGERDLAVAAYRSMSRIFPEDVAGAFNLGLLALEPNDPHLAKEVVAALGKNRAAWQGDASYALLLARLLCALERREEALAALAQVREWEPSLLKDPQVRGLPDYPSLLRLVAPAGYDNVL